MATIIGQFIQKNIDFKRSHELLSQNLNRFNIYITFHEIYYSCFDPTYCPTDPPIPLVTNSFYENPPRGTLKFEDGENVRYTCANSIYRFADPDLPKEEWKDYVDVVCGWDNQWDPPIVPGCVDPRGCQAPPPRNER